VKPNKQILKVNLGKTGNNDCPLFPEVFKVCKIISGASIGAARLLASNESDICINWCGKF
jgi:acetoin utilization deacetylase AcuC-like enzyme